MSQPPATSTGTRASEVTARTWVLLKRPFEGIHPLILVLFGISTLLSMLFFGQADLWHTVTASVAYLGGHFSDFYDFNTATIGQPQYLPSVYVLFAIWMAPLGAIGGISPSEIGRIELAPHEALWARVLLLIVFLATFYLVSAIARHAFPGAERVQLTVRTAYLLSPLAGFAVFNFGQYDIFSVLFTLLGVLMYFRRNSFWFVFWFSIAISFKYFAAFLFIPLVLFYFKRPLRIALALLGGSAFTALQLALYWRSPSFRSGAFQLAEGKASDPLHNQLQVLMGVIFLFICVAAYVYGRRRDDLTRPLVLIWASSYAVMLLAVTWHPQWTVLLAPAFALALGLMKRPGWFLLAESVAFLAFIATVVNRWAENVDAVMVTRGVLSSLLNPPSLLQRDFWGSTIEPYAGVFVTAMFILPLLWLGMERVAGLSDRDFVEPSRTVWVIRAVTVLVAFTLPSLALTFIPRDVALRFNPAAIQYGAVAVAPPEGEQQLLPASMHDVYEQDFVAQGDGLTGFRIPTATFLRANDAEIDIRLMDEAGRVIAEREMNASELGADQPVYLTFDPISGSGGQEYTLILEQIAPTEGDIVAFWSVPGAGGEDAVLSLNDTPQSAVLASTYFLYAQAG